MSIMEELFAANENFCAQEPPACKTVCSSRPTRHFAVLTCMDTRLVEFLEPALGIQRGEAKILKNAGNCVTGMFDSMVQSLLICVFQMGVQEVFVIGHDSCGMEKTTSEELMEKMLQRGIAPEAIAMVRDELSHWTDRFESAEKNVVRTVQVLSHHPLLPGDIQIHGLMFHPQTGRLRHVIA